MDIDSTHKKYAIRDYDTLNEIDIEYKNGCEVKNIYGKDIYYDKLKIGDVIVIGYDKNYSNIKYIHIDSDIVKFNELKKYKLNMDTYYIELDDEKYRLSEDTFVYYKNQECSIYDLNENDIISLSIKDKKVISLIIEKGHANIAFKNVEPYIGYNFIINDNISYEIEKGIRIVVPEGRNVFTIKNEKFTGSIVLNIIGGYDKVIDINDIEFEKRKEGNIRFYIKPKNARLYISGKSYDYDEEITLDYGKYKYVVESAGYNSHASTLVVDSDSKTISVQLFERKETEEPTNKKTEGIQVPNISGTDEKVNETIKPSE